MNGNSTLLRQNIGYFSALFALGLLIASLGPTLAALGDQTHSPLRSISFLFIARSTGFMLGSIFVGSIYDRVNGNLFLVFGMVVLAGMVVTTPMIGGLWLLTLAFLLQGMAGSIVNVGGNTLLLWANRERIGPLISGLHFTWGVGASISPVLITQTMLVTGGITVGYSLLAVLLLPIAVWIFRQPSPENPHTEVGQSDEEAPRGLVVLIGCFILLYAGIESSVGNWIYTYGLRAGGMNETHASYLNSLYWGMLTIGRLAVIPIAVRVRPRFILLMALGGALASVGLMMMVHGSPWVIWAGVAGLGLSYSSIFPTTLSFAERRITLTGRLTGRFFACSSGGAMIFPWLIGQFIETDGPRVLLWTVLVGLVGALAVFSKMISFPRRGEVH